MHDRAALHARETTALDDGTWRAVTLMPGAGEDVVVWAGRLRPEAIAKDTGLIDASDYSACTTTRFASRDEVSAHFDGTEYELLVGQLRDALELLGDRNETD